MQSVIIDGSNELEWMSPSLAALKEFYAGFNARDVDHAMESWARLDEVIMCNPIGGIRHGWDEIYEGYQRIMQGQTRIYVEFYDYQIIESGDIFFAVGRERGRALRDSSNQSQHIDLAIRTSRVFRKINNKWLQVHHHGSIDDPSLLKQYQEFIKGVNQ